MPRTKEITADSLRKETVAFPECVFLFGADLEMVDPGLQELDRKHRLGLGGALALTPSHWLHLDEFSIGRHMVSNAEYLRFLHYVTKGPDGQEMRIFDQSEIWDEIWNGLNFRIDRVKNSIRPPSGPVEEVEEFYGDASNFADAYISSIRYEAIRLLGSSEEGALAGPPKEKETRFFLRRKTKGESQRVELRRGDVIHRLFALIKSRLKNAVLSPEADPQTLLTEREREAIRYYDAPQKVIDDIQALTSRLRKKYAEQIDPRIEQRFAAGKHRVETILLLDRIRQELERDPESTSIPLHRVLYPRGWTSPDGKRKGGFVGGGVRHVPWGDLPVTGITFYEAMAYTLWLSTLTGLNVTLPSEAEFERASSWPLMEGRVAGKKIFLDPRHKHLFPWQTDRKDDFHFFFGREGEDLENFYVADRKAYEVLLSDTSRKIERRDRLYQLEGFGWQWTLDRLDHGEIRYSRFKDPGYRRYQDSTCKLADDPQTDAEVFDYRPITKMDCSLFVLKGSPEVVGGPGITTRRYSAYPLRAFHNVGMRVVVKD